jgi:hypothetical protein
VWSVTTEQRRALQGRQTETSGGNSDV